MSMVFLADPGSHLEVWEVCAFITEGDTETHWRDRQTDRQTDGQAGKQSEKD